MGTVPADGSAEAAVAAAPELRLVSRDADVDLAAAERAVADLLAALGQDLDDHHLRDTPRRVAASFAEMLSPRPFSVTTFPNDEGYDELVVARDIPFHSLYSYSPTTRNNAWRRPQTPYNHHLSLHNPHRCSSTTSLPCRPRPSPKCQALSSPTYKFPVGLLPTLPLRESLIEHPDREFYCGHDSMDGIEESGPAQGFYHQR